MESVSVVIPTRNRPEKLRRCLTALAEARELTSFEAHVCDSSDAASVREAVRKVCGEFEFVHYHRHAGKTASAARNFCAQVATTELLVNVDDDVYVRPDAILRLLEAYQRGRGWRVVAGSINWSGNWIGPIFMRRTGHGRRAHSGEPASFLVSAFFLYPRALALALPWNTRIRRSEDMFMGALWRSKGVALLSEPRAQAVHDEQHHYRKVEYVEFRTYANLFDTLPANRNLLTALCIEFFALAVGVKLCFRHPQSAWTYLAAWYRGHRALVRDWHYLQGLVRQPLPGIRLTPEQATQLEPRPYTEDFGRDVEQMTITALVPTYRRPRDLARCLEALKAQVRIPEEVLVVVRDKDSETRELLMDFDPGHLVLRTVTVEKPGTVMALNAGLDAAKGDIIAITDDDAAPRPDWLARIEKHFRADPRVGGVGGRDWAHRGGDVDDGAKEVVGKVRWFGRMISNHHLGVGGPREVDMLKGANSSYRRAALRDLRFDERLRGEGPQPYEDYIFSMTVKRAGWKLVYDPAVAVDHYHSPRIEGHRVTDETKHQFSSSAARNRIHNQTLMLLEYFPLPQRLVVALWALLVGSRSAYGLLQWVRFFPREDGLAGKKLRAALRGRLEGWKTWRRGRG